ncbi:MAG: carbonate dehydratase [Deltaproteobacteria bacterium]|nr:carbonate dehydratase [Deltaproteobacteria bacterium]
MTELDHLFEKNRKWAANITAKDPLFFKTLSSQQSPQYLWIGCADSRVPANEIVDLMPGELFVHRNVANIVIPSDLNCLSVLQFGVEVLKVRHIIVCGHYGCGGVMRAMGNETLGLSDYWLRHIKDIYHLRRQEVHQAGGEEERVDKLCELNVMEQVQNVCRTNIVQGAWERGQEISVHGWIYGLKNGLLKNLNVSVDSIQQIPPVYRLKDADNG